MPPTIPLVREVMGDIAEELCPPEAVPVINGTTTARTTHKDQSLDAVGSHL